MKVDKVIRVIAKVSHAEMLQLKITALLESKLEKIGKHTVRRDAPHFQGDEYHGHCKLPDGNELSWTISGKRRHPNKFPADNKIPSDAKLAVAKVLGVEPNKLEAYFGYDHVEGKNVFILQEQREA